MSDITVNNLSFCIIHFHSKAAQQNAQLGNRDPFKSDLLQNRKVTEHLNKSNMNFDMNGFI
jgi:hypothetical protein